MKKNKNFKISILKGLVLGLALNCVVICSFFTIDRLLYERIPSFEGLNYYEDIENNPRYRHLSFNITKIQSSKDQGGVVLQQTPAKHELISRVGNVVSLSIAAAKERMLIPDVYGISYDIAQQYLESCGLNVQIFPKTSMTEEFGVIIDVQPEVGSEAEAGDTVYLYYASDKNLVEVPNVIGYNVETAKDLLESVGLHLSTQYKYVDSSKRKGVVVYQSLDKGKKIPVGSYISIEVSSGKPKLVTDDITIRLPDASLNKVQQVQIYLNNDLIYNNNMLMDGSDYSFRVTGRGSRNILTFMVSDKKYYTCEIDFTKKPVRITNSKYRNLTPPPDKITESTTLIETEELSTALSTDTTANSIIDTTANTTTVENTTSFFDRFF